VSRLRWLLGFCSRSDDDFEKLSESDLARVRLEAFVFAFSGSGARSWYDQSVRYKAPEYEEVEEVTQRQLTPEEFVRLATVSQKFTASQLSALAREVETTIRRLLSGAGAVLAIGGGIWRSIDENFVPTWGGDSREVFRMVALDLIAAEGRRVARCSWKPCGTLFVRRKRGEYCSKRCSQRARTRRYYDTHPLEQRSEKRHGWYVQKVRRELGPNRKVRRNQRIIPSTERERNQ
jgi:hypothetical protein